MLDLAAIFDREDYVRSYSAGAAIFAEGDPGQEMHVVIEGSVDIVTEGKVLERIGRGGIFGEMALIDDSPRSASAVAGSDCRIAAINKRQFIYLVQETPSFSLQVMREMADRLRRRTHAG